MLGARRNRASTPRHRIPQTLVVLLRQRHRGVEADYWRKPSYVEDLLDDGFANFGVEIVQLRSVVPRIARPIVAVIDVACFAAPAIAATEDDCSIGLVVVMIFDPDLDSSVGGKIRPIEAIGGKRRIRKRDEPVGMLSDPARIDTGVVRDHISAHANPTGGGAISQIEVRAFASKLICDGVVE